MFQFSRSSLEALESVHPDLRAVAKLALSYSPLDFGVTEGARTFERQANMFDESKKALRDPASGKVVLTNTLQSKHLIQEDGYAHAIDIVVWYGGKTTYRNRHYRPVIQAFIRAAIDLGVQIEFGHLWRSLVDSCHIELA
jgi:peptidoglycan L-alanyl-D-glutamate endopeptidase CwlK